MIQQASTHFKATRNACKMCTPLGACLAFSGIEGCVPFIHGSQGCSTYIRRYLISHFREPMDIASSNFGEHAAIFGGERNLAAGLGNVIRGYAPKAIGIATTCLSETIGDDVRMYLRQFTADYSDNQPLPRMIHASTPSYTGSHFDGFVEAVRAAIDQIAEPGLRDNRLVNILPTMVSPADLRYLRQIVEGFGLKAVVMPDYADRMDGPTWGEYRRIPEGGTPLEQIASMGRAAASIELGMGAVAERTAGRLLAERFNVPNMAMRLPIGIVASDALFEALAGVAGRSIPSQYTAERGRLVDSYIDAHKYVFEKRAVVFGTEDMVVAVTALLAEVGITPALCASGGRSGTLAQAIADAAPQLSDQPEVLEGVDFEELTEAAASAQPDLIIGHSKGYKLARKLDVPLVRVGLPIHDRFGAARLLHVGYAGTQRLFDQIVNAILQVKQAGSEMGYTYL
jgi:nitrogenase molybdenum-iron protein NifN